MIDVWGLNSIKVQGRFFNSTANMTPPWYCLIKALCRAKSIERYYLIIPMYPHRQIRIIDWNDHKRNVHAGVETAEQANFLSIVEDDAAGQSSSWSSTLPVFPPFHTYLNNAAPRRPLFRNITTT